MQSNRTILPIAVLATVLALSACEKPAAKAVAVDTSNALATVNGETITEKEYEHFVSRLQRPIHPDKAKQKEIVLEQLVKRALLAQYAVKNKLDQEMDTHLNLKRQRESALINAARQKILQDMPKATDEQLKARYDKEVEAAPKKEYKVQHILLKAEDEAKAVIQKLSKGKKFDELAKSKSVGPTKDKGGHLGWLQKDAVVPEFFAAVSKLKKGAYTKSPVKSRFGWHVIKLLDTRPVAIPPFDKVKNSVAQLLQQEALDTKLAELHAAAKIEIK